VRDAHLGAEERAPGVDGVHQVVAFHVQAGRKSSTTKVRKRILFPRIVRSL
jgi:hypothetical protein